MKEASGEGSMTLITILIIAGIAAVGVAVIIAMTNKAEDTATGMDTNDIQGAVQEAVGNNN